MGDAMYRATRTTKHAFTLRSPTPYVEVQKALLWARQKFPECKGRPLQFDDDIMIEGDGETITVYFMVDEVDGA